MSCVSRGVEEEECIIIYYYNYQVCIMISLTLIASQISSFPQQIAVHMNAKTVHDMYNHFNGYR